jgi:hypothetical protein
MLLYEPEINVKESQIKNLVITQVFLHLARHSSAAKTSCPFLIVT